MGILIIWFTLCLCVYAGHLPDSLSKLSRLRVLYVSGNRLGGTTTLPHHPPIYLFCTIYYSDSDAPVRFTVY